MGSRFTDRAQRVILIAQEEAKRLAHDYVGTEHILLGLITLGEGVASTVFKNLGIDSRKVRMEIEKIVGPGDNALVLGEIPFTPQAKKVLEFAVEEAQQMGHTYIGTEHLLLGLLREEEGVASRVLVNLRLNLKAVRAEVLTILNDSNATAANSRDQQEEQAEEQESPARKKAEKAPKSNLLGDGLVAGAKKRRYS